MIKVLIADDSPTVCGFLEGILTEDPKIEVVAVVKDGVEAVEYVQRERPDVVTMDIEMPRMNGFEATRRIMETAPVPVVIVSGLSLAEQRATFRAFEAGAVAVVPRPPGFGHADFEDAVRELRNTVKAMAEVRVIRRWPKPKEKERKEVESSPPVGVSSGLGIVGIGASTGGPAAVKTILSGLPPEFPYPLVLVQHMSQGFLGGYADWLRSATGRTVTLGVDGEEMKAGQVYVAPESCQMGVTPDGRIVLTDEAPVTDHEPCPSVSRLFRSLAESYGPAAVGILLTGMGRDGADSMKLMKERGGVTIAQNAESCIVNGMPHEAIKLNAATYVLSPEQISKMLGELARRKK